MNSPQQRAALILQVRSGQMTAQEAAQQLGVSRQQYYRWEKRALQAMLSALMARPKGRPKTSSACSGQKALQSQIAALEKRVRLYEEKEQRRARLKELEESRNSRGSSVKKNTK